MDEVFITGVETDLDIIPLPDGTDWIVRKDLKHKSVTYTTNATDYKVVDWRDYNGNTARVCRRNNR